MPVTFPDSRRHFRQTRSNPPAAVLGNATAWMADLIDLEYRNSGDNGSNAALADSFGDTLEDIGQINGSVYNDLIIGHGAKRYLNSRGPAPDRLRRVW